MELILFGIGFIALLATIVVKAKKRDPRFAGQRIFAAILQLIHQNCNATAEQQALQMPEASSVTWPSTVWDTTESKWANR